jgi:hypothetical protein
MTGSGWPPSYPPPLDDPVPLRGRVLDALFDEGLSPNVDDDGDVAYAVRGQRLFVRCVEAGEEVGRVRGSAPLARVFGQWRLGDAVPDDELVRLRACNDVISRYDLVKASIHADVLLVVVDLVVPDQPDLRPLLTAASDGVLSAVRAWHAAAGGRMPGSGSGSGRDRPGEAGGAGEDPGPPPGGRGGSAEGEDGADAP